MTFAVALSRCIWSSEALLIEVETHLSNGLPSFTIVGLPEAAVRESRDRVRSALQNAGFEFPRRRITVNLAPGDVPKEGTRFDLAIALGILAASGQVPAAALARVELVGELALDGQLRASGASLAAALAAAADGRELIVAPRDAAIASLVEDACVRAATSLAAVVRHLNGEQPLERSVPPPARAATAPPDLADVRGQARARRTLEIAASGAHHLLMIGPPGTGKSMLAARLPGLLPALTTAEALASAAIHSIAGTITDPAGWRARPYRAPHHSSSAAALVGGGRVPRPGEISLAHHGVLFLDELPEFDRRALEALREPLETGRVSIARAAAAAVFPAAFQLVCAMNPCPCGYDGDPRVECRCTPERIARYRARVSGPLADRIDVHLEVARESFRLHLPDDTGQESSAAVAARVLACRKHQQRRQGMTNAALDSAAVYRLCLPEAAALRLLERAGEQLALSARGHHKVLRVARTIADLDGDETIREAHMAEAIGLRTLDRPPAGR